MTGKVDICFMAALLSDFTITPPSEQETQGKSKLNFNPDLNLTTTGLNITFPFIAAAGEPQITPT